jgi:hypothetical protein
VALRYTQILLEEYFSPKSRNKITYRELLDELRSRKVTESVDLAILMTPFLSNKGISMEVILFWLIHFFQNIFFHTCMDVMHNVLN